MPAGPGPGPRRSAGGQVAQGQPSVSSNHLVRTVASADTAEARGASVLPAYRQVFLLPGMLVLALVRAFDRTTHARAGHLETGTLLGALAVAVVTLAVTA